MTSDIPSEVTLEPTKQTPSTSGMTTKVVKGSIWTIGSQVTPLAVSVVTTPLIIRMLGAESYGVLILIGLIPTYLGFADFGMSTASTKFASEAFGEGDEGKEALVIQTSALIALCTSVPVAALVIAFAAQLVALFNVPTHLANDAVLGLRIASVTFVVTFLNNVVTSPAAVRMRMDQISLINTIFKVLGLILVPVVLYFGGGIVEAILTLLICSILTLISHIFTARRFLPGMIGFSISRKTIRSLLQFGWGFVLSGIAAMALMNAEKGILAASVSPLVLGHYSVAFSLSGTLALFSGAVVQALLPAFSQLQNDGDKRALNVLYTRGVRISLLWIVPGIGVALVLAKPFLLRWLGEDFGLATLMPFYVLIVGVGFNMVAFVPYTALLASGKTRALAKIYWVELIPYAILVWVLSSRWGAVGAAIAWSSRVVVDSGIQFLFAKRSSRMSIIGLRSPAWLVAIIIMTLPFVLSIYVGSVHYLTLMVTTVCLVSYVLVVWKLILSSEETSWIKTWIETHTIGLRRLIR